MKVAVIGSGISGLSCAWLLSAKHEVALFERDARLGGHTNTVTVKTAAGEQPVDTGFIVYNQNNYPLLTAMFRELGVVTQPCDMSFGVSIGDGAFEYAGDTFATLFLQASNLVSRSHWRMLTEILRFNATTKRLLDRNDLPGGSLVEFLDAHGFGSELRTRYLLPMAGAIWSCSTRQALAFPYAEFARFFDSHGLLNTVNRAQWRSVVGGSKRYLDRIVERFKGSLRLGAGVEQVRRTEDAVWLDGERFDAVVCASHSDQTLALLADADEHERKVLGAIAYADNVAYLHTDESLLPKRRRAWSCWNYSALADAISDERIALTYWMNPLQAIDSTTNYLVSLNPPRKPSGVLYETVYAHPQFNAEAVAAQALLPAIQGKRRTWFCGAWTGYGFHEDGLKSALRVAAAFGCKPSWTPDAVGEIQPALPKLEPDTVQT